jgi:diphosphomevalonate decarboxylase
MTTSTAQANPNLAFIKYWGNRDNTLHHPMNGSISMNLDGLYTRTTVSFQPSLPYDELIINRHEVMGRGWIASPIFSISFAAWRTPAGAPR